MNLIKTLTMIPFLFFSLNVSSQNPDFVKMVEYATKAPSGHNTQPWIFKLTDSTIEIHPDFSKALPVVDGHHRELYISLGCALENLCIAANEFGYDAKTSIEVDDNSHSYIIAKLEKSRLQKNYLFDQIVKRQTNRSVYNNKLISSDTIKELERISMEEHIDFQFFDKNTHNFNVLMNLVAEGNTQQLNDKAFKKELLEWIRFNKKQVEATKDGLTYEVMGTPATPGFIGKPIVKSFLKPDKQNKTDMQKINSSSHLVLFTVEHNNPENWINLGRVLERILLETTRLGIANAYLNQPCEVESVAESVQNQLQLGNKKPALLLRIGYANPLPYSPRKEVYEVIE